MGGGIGSAAGLDVWVVVAFMVVGALVLAWRARPAKEQPPSEDAPGLGASGSPLDVPAHLEAAREDDLEHVDRDEPEQGDEGRQDHAA